MFIIRSKIDPELQKTTDHPAGVYRFLFGRNLDHWSVLYEKKIDLIGCTTASDVIDKLSEIK